MSRGESAMARRTIKSILNANPKDYYEILGASGRVGPDGSVGVGLSGRVRPDASVRTGPSGQVRSDRSVRTGRCGAVRVGQGESSTVEDGAGGDGLGEHWATALPTNEWGRGWSP